MHLIDCQFKYLLCTVVEFTKYTNYKNWLAIKWIASIKWRKIKQQVLLLLRWSFLNVVLINYLWIISEWWQISTIKHIFQNNTKDLDKRPPYFSISWHNFCAKFPCSSFAGKYEAEALLCHKLRSYFIRFYEGICSCSSMHPDFQY